jgi:hypothetical protein
MELNLLEEKSLWYKYKFQVWPENNAQAFAVHNIMRTLRTIYNLKELGYISVPITSGKKLFDELGKLPVSSERLNFLTGPASTADKIGVDSRFKKIINDVISDNFREGSKLCRELEKRLTKPFLYPAYFYPRGDKWSQDHFQALWLTLISELCTELHMSENWQYSSGASEEFTHVFQLKLGIPRGGVSVKGQDDCSPFYNTKMTEEESRERMKNIAVFDHEGKPLSLEDGIKKINEVLPWIEDRGFNTMRLENARNLLIWTGDMIAKGYYQ